MSKEAEYAIAPYQKGINLEKSVENSEKLKSIPPRSTWSNTLKF